MKMNEEKKAYEVRVSYLDPREALISMMAKDEEDARVKILENFGELPEFFIHEITEMSDDDLRKLLN